MFVFVDLSGSGFPEVRAFSALAWHQLHIVNL
jgi:hypothetical protein